MFKVLPILFCFILENDKKHFHLESALMSKILVYYDFLNFINFYFWLHWVFVAARGLSLVATSEDFSSLQCAGFSLRWLLLLRSTGSRRAGSVVVACRLSSTGSVVVAHGLSCSTACGIFMDQGSNLCPLHWQADS